LCVFVPLAMLGHGRFAAILFLGWIVMAITVFLRMKPTPADLAPFRKAGQTKTIKRIQRTGYFYVAALILGLCLTDYRNLLWWPTLTGIAISGFFIWSTFRAANRFKNMSSEEWERRYGN
jgi:hypothetical protein